MPKLYEYVLEIAKDKKYNKMVIRESEIIAENKTQYVYDYQGVFYILDKKEKLYAKFVNNSFFYKVPFYRVCYYTTKLGKQSENVVIKALKKLADETCFINDVVNNIDIKFTLIKSSGGSN